MMECGEGREGLLPGTEVGVGEKVEEEAGEIGDEKSHPGYLREGEMGRNEVAKLKEEEGGGRGSTAAMERHTRQESLRLRL